MGQPAAPDPSHVDRVRARLGAWVHIGAANWVVSWLEEGLRLPLGREAREALVGRVFGVTAIEDPVRRAWLRDEIKRKVECGAWALLPASEAHRFCVTRAFVIPKPHRVNEFRDIWDLRPVNKFLPRRTFRFEGLHTLARMIGRNWWFATIDLKEAYHHIGLHPTAQPFIAFLFEGQLVVSKVLPFGLSWSPWVLTKTMREVLAHWRRQALMVVIYMDDLIVFAPSAEGCERTLGIVLADLERLGLMVNRKKCRLTPTQRGEWLGVTIDTRNGVFEVTEDQMARLETELDELLRAAEQSDNAVVGARAAAKLAGRIVCWRRALPPAMLVTRELFNCLSAVGGQYDVDVRLSPEAIGDLSWLRQNLRRWNGKSMWRAKRIEVVQVTTDASGTFWAGHFGDLHVRGSLSPRQQAMSSTARELLAVLGCLRELREHLRGKALQVRSDNRGVVADLRKGASRSLRVWPIVKEIWTLALESDVELTDPMWIPRDRNGLADFLSRPEADTGDWQVDISVLGQAMKRWGQLTVDRFASAEYHLLRRFNSRWYCAAAEAVDAFTQDWAGEHNWLVPPFGAIGRALEHLIACRASAVILLPLWPAQWWWPLLLLVKRSEFVEVPRAVLKAGPSGAFEPGRNEEWSMVMCSVSAEHLGEGRSSQ